MRIAQVSPLYESVPPKMYGGTERVVSWLTEELVSMGHDVTLYASGDSQTSARLVSPCRESLRLCNNCIDQLAHHILMLEMVAQDIDQFDVIHFHVDYMHFPLTRRLKIPHVTTLHGRLDIPDLQALYNEFNDVPIISISDSQRRPLMQGCWLGTVYHGLPMNLFNLHKTKGDYLAFVGRISPEKRVDRAIEIAKATGKKLKIAAKIDKADREYFHSIIEPLLDDPLVEYVGEVSDAQKNDFMGGAEALLFPIDWPEPFGLVMIESMACGTPVIAFGCGSVPEIIDEGVTGFIVKDVDQAIDAVKRIGGIDRRACRDRFEERFVSAVMARNYINFYQKLIKTKHDMIPEVVNVAT